METMETPKTFSTIFCLVKHQTSIKWQLDGTTKWNLFSSLFIGKKYGNCCRIWPRGRGGKLQRKNLFGSCLHIFYCVSHIAWIPLYLVVSFPLLSCLDSGCFDHAHAALVVLTSVCSSFWWKFCKDKRNMIWTKQSEWVPGEMLLCHIKFRQSFPAEVVAPISRMPFAPRLHRPNDKCLTNEDSSGHLCHCERIINTTQ